MSQPLTLTEASNILGDKVETLKKRCQSGCIIGAIKKGKTWLIPQEYVFGPPKIKVGVYIDGANILHGGLDAGWLIDFSKLITFIKSKYNPVIISYYDSCGYEKDGRGNLLRDSNGNLILSNKQLKFFNYLIGLGMRVIHKPLKYIDGDVSKPKNNMDSYLTLDIIRESQQWDTLILLSGDSDFDKLIDDLISLNKEIKIMSYNKRLSYELRIKALNNPSVNFTEMENLEKILKSDRKKA